MKSIQTLSLLLTLGITAPLLADVSPSINIPAGGEAVQTNPPEAKVKPVPKAVVKANREARRTPVLDKSCNPSASVKGKSDARAIAACPPVNTPRTVEPSLNSPTVVQPAEPAAVPAPTQEPTPPVNPSVDVNGVTGR